MLLASPRFYPGQVVEAGLSAEALPGSTVALFCHYYDPDDRLTPVSGSPVRIEG